MHFMKLKKNFIFTISSLILGLELNELCVFGFEKFVVKPSYGFDFETLLWPSEVLTSYYF